MTRFFWLILIIVIPKATAQPVQSDVWTIGLTSVKHSLKAKDGIEFIGPAAALQIGYGSIGDYWFANGYVDILLGPYQPTQGGQMDVDYTGTGLSVEAGLSAHSNNIRSPDGGYGFVMGFNYGDTQGRGTGISRKSRRAPAFGFVTQESAGLDEYSQRVTYFALAPQIFFSWLGQPRPIGNTPELLATRIEGYMLTIGGIIPLSANYSVRYATDNNESVRKHGSLYGYSMTASFRIVLGP